MYSLTNYHFLQRDGRNSNLKENSQRRCYIESFSFYKIILRDNFLVKYSMLFINVRDEKQLFHLNTKYIRSYAVRCYEYS